jgi:hypothetical protein
MLSIAEWLFPGRDHCVRPCCWYTSYTPCEQYSDCSLVLSQIDVPVLYSLRAAGFYDISIASFLFVTKGKRYYIYVSFQG